ncbi:hypothetical protein JCM10296v2_005448 [Rhodotorula toruloides]
MARGKGGARRKAATGSIDVPEALVASYQSMNASAQLFDDLCVVCDKRTTQKCSGCNETRFCSRVCQKTVWATHKWLCRHKGKPFSHAPLDESEKAWLRVLHLRGRGGGVMRPWNWAEQLKEFGWYDYDPLVLLDVLAKPDDEIVEERFAHVLARLRAGLYAQRFTFAPWYEDEEDDPASRSGEHTKRDVPVILPPPFKPTAWNYIGFVTFSWRFNLADFGLLPNWFTRMDRVLHQLLIIYTLNDRTDGGLPDGQSSAERRLGPLLRQVNFDNPQAVEHAVKIYVLFNFFGPIFHWICVWSTHKWLCRNKGKTFSHAPLTDGELRWLLTIFLDGGQDGAMSRPWNWPEQLEHDGLMKSEEELPDFLAELQKDDCTISEPRRCFLLAELRGNLIRARDYGMMEDFRDLLSEDDDDTVGSESGAEGSDASLKGDGAEAVAGPDGGTEDDTHSYSSVDSDDDGPPFDDDDEEIPPFEPTAWMHVGSVARTWKRFGPNIGPEAVWHSRLDVALRLLAVYSALRYNPNKDSPDIVNRMRIVKCRIRAAIRSAVSYAASANELIRHFETLNFLGGEGNHAAPMTAFTGDRKVIVKGDKVLVHDV